MEGWSIDVWHLSSGALAALKRTYSALAAPEVERLVLRRLASDGINIHEIFLDPEKADPTVTRADMVELAAAASMVAVEGLQLASILMPNVPKESRRKSESGIDVLAAHFDPSGNPESLEDGEILFIGSAKHSISDAGDLRRKLVSSVSERELTLLYLTNQLRVYHGRLQERGITADRVFLFIRGEPVLNPKHTRLVCVGAVDSTKEMDFVAQLSNLSRSESRLRHLRCLLIPDIVNLHTLVNL